MVRRGFINDGREVLFTDTVGFIEKLPQQLVTAFQATLEEVSAADILIHVVDLSHPDYMNQIKVVREHLANIDPDYYLRELLVFNKTDLVAESSESISLERNFPTAAFISALKKEGLETLKNNIAAFFQRQQCELKLYLPYSEGKLYSELQDHGYVQSVEYKTDCLEITAVVDPELAAKLKRYTFPLKDNAKK